MKTITRFASLFLIGVVVFVGMKTAEYFLGPPQSTIIVCVVKPGDGVEECRPFQDWGLEEDKPNHEQYY